MTGTGGESGGNKAPNGGTGETDVTQDLTAAAVEVIPPEIVAQSLGQYMRAWLARVRNGDAGVLPVVAALVAVTIVFQIVSPNHIYLSAGNLVNLFDQSAVFIVLGMGEIFVLLLGEIDLAIGYVAAIGGILAAEFVQPDINWPWWLAIIVALLICAGIGAIHGIIITQLRLPSFVVTLAGNLFWFGVMIIILGPAGGVSVTSTVQANQRALSGIVYTYINPFIGWIGLVVIVALMGGFMWLRDSSRRRSGLVAPPVGLTLAKIAFIAVAGIAVVAICNINRGQYLPIVGVPWVVPLVLVVLGISMVLLEQTQFGRHMYAVGGNPEAARRAGVGVTAIRTWAFVLCSLTAGIAGIIYASQLGGITTNINGGQYVLYAVAAAVIGGTSLMGGRGRAVHGLLGGLVIGAIYNGLYLLGLQIQWQLIATGLVLIAAVTIDSLSRRGATSGSMARV
ncbi:MAG: sugar ABC transporter permease [Candidatus Limnocylindrales bacterium]